MVSGRSHICEGPKEDENGYAHNAKARSGFALSLPSAGTQSKFLRGNVSWVL